MTREHAGLLLRAGDSMLEMKGAPPYIRALGAHLRIKGLRMMRHQHVIAEAELLQVARLWLEETG